MNPLVFSTAEPLAQVITPLDAVTIKKETPASPEEEGAVEEDEATPATLPQPLHKPQSLFVRSLTPLITREDLLQVILLFFLFKKKKFFYFNKSLRPQTQGVNPCLIVISFLVGHCYNNSRL